MSDDKQKVSTESEGSKENSAPNIFLVPEKLMKGIFSYLQTRPAGEVYHLMRAMENVPATPLKPSTPKEEDSSEESDK